MPSAELNIENEKIKMAAIGIRIRFVLFLFCFVFIFRREKSGKNRILRKIIGTDAKVRKIKEKIAYLPTSQKKKVLFYSLLVSKASLLFCYSLVFFLLFF